MESYCLSKACYIYTFYPPSAARPMVAPIPPNLCPLHTIVTPIPLHPTHSGRKGKEEERERNASLFGCVHPHL